MEAADQQDAVAPSPARGDLDLPKLRLFGRPSFGGATVGLIFWWRSLYPTLMPRSWAVQAAITAICVAVGYAIGTLAGHIGHRLLQRLDREPAAGTKRGAWTGLGVVAVGMLVLSFVLWPAWQNDQRDLLAMDHIAVVVTVPTVLLAVVLLGVLVLIGRLVARGVIRLHRFNVRHLPRPLAIPLTVVLVLVVTSFLLRVVLATQFTSWANSSFGTIDDGTNEGTIRPTSTLVSGGQGSRVGWDDLGVQGRDFVAGGTTQSDLAGFYGTDAVPAPKEPIRVYVGLKSADTVEERAALAVDELVRTGAFDREILVVATSTGTGWIDPDAARALEMVHRGDTAIVSMQYSFLPSWISTLVDKQKAKDAGRVLYDTVYRRWSALPAGERPEIVAFGLSLGSFGGEAAFAGDDAEASVADMVERTDGALWVGPPNDNTIWNQITDAREEGSPVWRPVYDGGSTVRFANRDPAPDAQPADWKAPRILFVQHPSDPVVFWGFDSFVSPSPWMAQPRGYDVPTTGGWFPIVTGTQGVFDLMAGFSAPPGHGHDYRLDYVGAWSEVAPPEGWSAADEQRLQQYLFPS